MTRLVATSIAILALLLLPASAAAVGGAGGDPAPATSNQTPKLPVDPFAPTEIGVQAHGPGPIETATVDATVYHNASLVGVSLHEDATVAPTTQNETLDTAAQNATQGTPAHPVLWGFQSEQNGSAVVLAR